MLLVTGGAGFIGSHLADALLQRNYRVRILDNLSTGKRENLAEVSGVPLANLPPFEPGRPVYSLGKRMEFLFGDISDLVICRKACEGVSHVFHLAALGSVQRSVEDPVASHRANATGTLHMLQASKEAGAKKFLYASSSSVYGNVLSDPEGARPKDESLPLNPQSPYAATKLLGEIYCRLFSTLYGMETVTLRYFNVFGPRQNPDSIYAAVIPKFIAAVRQGNSPVIYGDGDQSRDFTYVANVVQANLLALEKPGISGQLFNIACGGQTTVNELMLHLQRISGSRTPARYEKPREGEVRHSMANIRLAKTLLGYEMKVGLAEGLLATYQWFNSINK